MKFQLLRPSLCYNSSVFFSCVTDVLAEIMQLEAVEGLLLSHGILSS